MQISTDALGHKAQLFSPLTQVVFQPLCDKSTDNSFLNIKKHLDVKLLGSMCLV